jgi:hypothetical protein
VNGIKNGFENSFTCENKNFRNSVLSRQHDCALVEHEPYASLDIEWHDLAPSRHDRVPLPMSGNLIFVVFQFLTRVNGSQIPKLN